MGTKQDISYLIRVEGQLDPKWSPRLGGMRIEAAKLGKSEITELRGELADGAALSGVLTTLFDLHFELISAERIVEGGS
jgi:hypothetical protein